MRINYPSKTMIQLLLTKNATHYIDKKVFKSQKEW